MKKNTILKIVAGVLLTFGANAFAQNTGCAAGLNGPACTPIGPNKVFIEQIGSYNVVTIEQVGTTNNVGGVAGGGPGTSNYAKINGSNNTLTITQTGDVNKAQYDLQGNDNQYTSTVTGNDNATKLTIGDANNANNLRNIITETIVGDSNTVVQNVVGSDIVSLLSINGDSNQITKNLLSSFGQSDVTIVGNSNKLDIEQTGTAGAVGHRLVQSVTGDFNSIVTQQQGTNDTTVNISVNGGHNAITVRTSSVAIVSPLTAVTR
jgi:hypothetical protein